MGISVRCCRFGCDMQVWLADESWEEYERDSRLVLCLFCREDDKKCAECGEVWPCSKPGNAPDEAHMSVAEVWRRVRETKERNLQKESQ